MKIVKYILLGIVGVIVLSFVLATCAVLTEEPAVEAPAPAPTPTGASVLPGFEKIVKEEAAEGDCAALEEMRAVQDQANNASAEAYVDYYLTKSGCV